MSKKIEQAAGSIDASKRDTVKKLVTAAAFTAPAISTFAIDSKMNAAFAQTVPNGTTS